MPTERQTAGPRSFITLAEAADHLSVTERTVRNYIARGQLTGYRVGPRAIRVDAAELDRMLVPIPTAAGDAA